MTEQVTVPKQEGKVRVPRLRRPAFPLGIVVWDDANVDSGETGTEDIAHRAWRFHSVGWIVRDDERGVSVAAEWAPDQATWRGVTFVPRGMVIEVRKL